ncbi:phage major capsid protein, partial [Clostridium sp.]|uniref:phage major capsid protein n=1 Tax=Clostridium sp. TaxID=1506 RepID=UPI003F4BE876
MKKIIKRILELRSLPTLVEQRNVLLTEMDGIVAKAKEETRAFAEAESTRFEAIKVEVAAIDKTLKAEEEARSFEKKEEKKEETRTQEEMDNEELRNIFGGKVVEKRSDAMNTGTPAQGGIVVNEVLTGAIIKDIVDRSDVLKFFNSTSIPGTLRIPKKASSGTASWEDEQVEPDATSKASIATLEMLELGQKRLYRESALTQQMINVQELDLRSFIIDDISETMGDALELAIFQGDGVKRPLGILGSVPAASKIALTVRGTLNLDYFKKCKAKLKKAAQKKAKWFMQADTLLAVDLLKDADGRPLLQPDLTKESDYTILGLPVEITDA